MSAPCDECGLDLETSLVDPEESYNLRVEPCRNLLCPAHVLEDTEESHEDAAYARELALWEAAGRE